MFKRKIALKMIKILEIALKIKIKILESCDMPVLC